ncbi:hypothetical protein M3147_17960 [Agromyces mediolanus]|uniref:hypothetical protein n=1 Tax=Agromyces mediolanus TaxID=41986 RepID=UPI002041CE56|nr:hypothetical protein [Agromyces mediolanus]MCM3659142.1 hypothetical protein [Agromyces mediolanus]
MNDGIKWGLPVLGAAALGTLGLVLGTTALADGVVAQSVITGAVAESRAEEALGDLRGATTLARGQVLEGEALAGAFVDGLGDPALAEALTADVASAREIIDDAALELPEPPAYDHGPLTPVWTSLAEAVATQERTARLAELEQEAESGLAGLHDAEQQLAEARSAFYADAAADAQAVLDASTVASYESRVPAMHAIAQDGETWFVEQDDSAEGYEQLAAAVAAVRDSQTAETARRAAPEYASRGPIEEFARSIAHGVHLDFAWDHVVNGLSSEEWYSGTAQYWYGDGGWAKLHLSYSIDWSYADDVNAKAVVVHEVGHTQVVRPECTPIFESAVFGSDDEMWATAWAIAAGYDLPGSGIEAYGRPSDEQIAEAGRCV